MTLIREKPTTRKQPANILNLLLNLIEQSDRNLSKVFAGERRGGSVARTKELRRRTPCLLPPSFNIYPLQECLLAVTAVPGVNLPLTDGNHIKLGKKILA